MSDGLSMIIGQLGFGGAGGFLAGYVAKKIVKILAFFGGIAFLGLLYLHQKGIVMINYEKLTEMILSAFTAMQSNLLTFATNISFGGSFALGFVLGLKAG